MLVKRTIPWLFGAMLLVSACGEPIVDSVGADGSAGDTNTAAESSTTTTVELAASTTTTEATVPDARVTPGAPRLDLPVATGTFAGLAGGGDRHVVALASVDGDYVIADAETGDVTVVYDARALQRWSRVGSVIHHGAVSYDDPFLQQQTAAQSLVATAVEQQDGAIVDFGGRPAAEFAFQEVYDFDEFHVVTDYVIAVDLETGLIVRYDENQIEPKPDPSVAVTKAEAGPATSDATSGEDVFRMPAAAVTQYDDGFELMLTFEAAGKRAGYAVLRPGWMPDGFELVQIAYAADSSGRSNVVVITYRNWTYRIDVLMQDSVHGDDLENPFSDRFDSSAAVSGNYLVADGDQYVPSHAWGRVGEQIVSVSGGVSTKTIAQIVESLG